MNITSERLRELFIYEPEIGLLKWRAARGKARAGTAAGYKHPSGYILVEVDGRYTSAHRIIWCMMTGSWPVEIDHLNQFKDDNRWSNLRNSTRKQNCINRPLRSDNRLGFKGVGRDGNRYRARITIDGKLKVLGYFDTPEEASAVYVLAAQAAHGEFYCGR